MTISGIGNTPAWIQSLVQMRSQLDDLQRQLSTGQKSQTYSGLGLDRGFVVGLNSQLSAIGGYDAAIQNVNTRLSVTQTTLDGMSGIATSIKSAANTLSYDPDPSGQTTAQKTAFAQLGAMIGLLNTQVGDQYIFSGSATDTPSVETLDHILNGDGARAGLKQLIDERTQADYGTLGIGRLQLSNPTATSIKIAEENVPFGLKVNGMSASWAGATLTQPTGTPPDSMTVDVATNPNAGDNVTFNFKLPDGTTEHITLTATTNNPPGPNQFTIGATTTDTANSLQTALNGALGTLADTSLKAASAIVASNDFFTADAGNPPPRVVGSPLTSTSLTPGTTANTVIWYTGENGAAPARSTASIKVDPSISVNYGTRANEEGLRWVLQNVATMAAVTYSPNDPDGQQRALALNQRLVTNLGIPPGTQSVANIQAELAGAQNSMKTAQARHQQTSATLQDFLQQITGVSEEEVGSQILTLQTRLQASLQTTSILYQTSLVNYLK